MFIRFFWLLIFLLAVGGLRMVERGDMRGLVFFVLCVMIWNWRWVLEFIMSRRWREWG